MNDSQHTKAHRSYGTDEMGSVVQVSPGERSAPDNRESNQYPFEPLSCVNRNSSASFVKAAFSKDSWWISLALIAAIAVIYAQVRHFAFINYDDLDYVPNNPRMDGAFNWAGVRWAFTTGYFSNWLPLTWLSHMLDVQLFGFRAGAHHLTNVAFHAANSVLLFGLLRAITGTKWRSAFVAAVFAVHPLHVQSVAWISERKDVLSTLFLFLTIGAYARYVRQPTTKNYVFIAIFFAFGLMSKPMLVTAPFALLLLDIWPFRRIQLGQAQGTESLPASTLKKTPLALFVEKLPLIAMSIACAVATLTIQRQDGAIVSSAIFPLSHRIKNALLSYVTYICQTIWPTKLALLYPQHFISFRIAISCFAVLSLITLATIAGFRKKPYLFVGWFWFFGTLLPVIGLIQAGDQARADRYMYVPMIGLLIMAAWGFPDLRIRWRHYRLLLSTAAVVAVALYVPVSIAQAAHWRDSLTVWENTLSVTTENHVAHDILGSALINRGRFGEAIGHLNEALRIDPDFAAAHISLAICLYKTGREQEAIYHLEEAHRLKPDLVDYYAWMGLIMANKGRTQEAIRIFKVAVELKPDSAEIRNSLGIALATDGKMDDAIAQFQKAVQIRPHSAEAQNSLGVALASQGKAQEAVPHFIEALRMRPESLDWRVNLARALNDSGQRAEALHELTEILRVDPNNAEVRQALNQIRGTSGDPVAGTR